MPRLSEHERSGAIEMLKAGVRVSDVARYHYCHPPTIQRLRNRYQAIGTVKDRHRSGQPRMATAVKRQLTSIVYRRYLHRRCPFRLATVSAKRIVGLHGYFVSDFLIKIFYHNNLKLCPISRQISNCNFIIIEYCYLIDCCSNINYHFDIKLKTCFAGIVIFIFAKSQKN